MRVNVFVNNFICNIIKSVIDELLFNVKKSAEYASIKLIKPYVPPQNKIGISNVEDVIDTNYTQHCKWTIIRDIDGYCLNKYLNYNSTVINMDSYDNGQEAEIRKTVQQAISKGLWVTFSFKETLCTMVSVGSL